MSAVAIDTGRRRSGCDAGRAGRCGGAPAPQAACAGGEWESAWRNHLTDREARELVRAAELFDEGGRKKLRAERSTRRGGPLGHVAIRLLKLISNTAHRHKGWVYWSVEELAKRLGHGETAVHQAKERLRRHGFLDWARRYVEVDGAGHSRGPQVEQTSNLYRLSLPAMARKLLGIFGRRPPEPVDEAARKAAMRAEIDAHLKAEFAAKLDASPAVRRANAKAALERERNVAPHNVGKPGG